MLKVHDIILWTLFGGIAGLLFGSLLGLTAWKGMIIGLAVAFAGSIYVSYRRKKEEEKYKV